MSYGRVDDCDCEPRSDIFTPSPSYIYLKIIIISDCCVIHITKHFLTEKIRNYETMIQKDGGYSPLSSIFFRFNNKVQCSMELLPKHRQQVYSRSQKGVGKNWTLFESGVEVIILKPYKSEN